MNRLSTGRLLLQVRWILAGAALCCVASSSYWLGGILRLELQNGTGTAAVFATNAESRVSSLAILSRMGAISPR
jgi:hypothetical protein